MTDAMPVVNDGRSLLRRERQAEIANIYEMSGVDGLWLYDPANPPMEVLERGTGLTLSETQTRDLHAQLGAIVSGWDKKGSRK